MKNRFLFPILLIGAGLCTAGLVSFLLKTEKEIIRKAQEKDVEEQRDYSDFLTSIRNQRNLAPIEATIRNWLRADTQGLSDQHRRDLYLAIAESVDRYCEGHHSSSDCFEYAVKFYRRAVSVSNQTKDRSNLTRKLTKRLVREKKWSEAIRLFEESENYLVTPEERWRSYFQWAQCLKEIGRRQDSIERLTIVIDEADVEDIWGKAALLKADQLYDIYSNTHDTGDIENPSSTNTNPKNSSRMRLDEAKALYEEIIETIPQPDINRTRAGNRITTNNF